MAPGLTDHDRPGPPVADLSPEARRKEALKHKAGLPGHVAHAVGPGSKFRDVLTRVFVGTYNDGFIHAGNLAYLAVLSIFPCASRDMSRSAAITAARSCSVSCSGVTS